MITVDRIRALATQNKSANEIAIALRIAAPTIAKIALASGIALAPNVKAKLAPWAKRAARESSDAKRHRAEYLSGRRCGSPEPWALDGEKNEALYGGYVLRLWRYVWQYGNARPPFTVKPRMGRPPRAQPVAAE